MSLLPRRAETPGAAILIKMAAGLEAVEVALIDDLALALEIGAVIAPFLGALIPIEPQPAQPIVNDLDCLDSIPSRVRVLHPKHKCAAVMPGV